MELIDVIVVGFERPEETYLTVEALLEANDDIRVILIHDGSIQRPNLIELPTDRIIEVMLHVTRGQARAVNLGLDISKSEYVVVCHNDVVIKDKNWVAKAVNFLKTNPEAGLVAAMGTYFPCFPSNERKFHITSLSQRDGVLVPSEDFTEVPRTDSVANVFKNDGIRIDERYKWGGIETSLTIQGRGLKLYVMKFEDGRHMRTSSRTLKRYNEMTSWKEERRHQSGVTNQRFKELNIDFDSINDSFKSQFAEYLESKEV